MPVEYDPLHGHPAASVASDQLCTLNGVLVDGFACFINGVYRLFC